jgi:ABC-type uncharacterized transport system involved in gliding motility auxiliary subunit
MGKAVLKKSGPDYLIMFSKISWISVVFITLLSVTIAIQLGFIRYNKSLDLTESQKFSLSEQTLKILENLKDEIKIKAFYEKGRYFEVYEPLNKFSVNSPLIKIEMINTDRNPKISKDHGIVKNGQCVLFAGERHKSIQGPGETYVVSAIIELTTEIKRQILFSHGHGERRIGDSKGGGLSIWRDELKRESCGVKDIALIRNQVINSGIDLLVFPGPGRDLAAGEAETLGSYLESGGSVLILLDPGTFPVFEGFLNQYDIQLRDDIIVDEKNRFINKDKFSPLIPFVEKHVITEGTKAVVFFSMARSVFIKEGLPPGVKTQNLLISSLTSQSVPYETGVTAGIREDVKKSEIYPGPIPVAALSEVYNREQPGTPGRLVVLGDYDFVFKYANNHLGNKDLILNATNWLVKRDELVGPRPESRMYGYQGLTPAHARLLFVSTVVIMPGLGFFLAVLFFVRRRIKN